MDRNGIVIGIAAVFSGITVLMLIVGVVVSPFFLLAALPFGGAAYLLWYQASGRLAERVQREAAGAAGRNRSTAGFDPGGFGARRTAEGRDPRERARRTRQNRRRARASATGEPTLSATDARRILEVDDTASEDDIKAAYRRKAKEHHPDTDSGDEETFKKVSRAYETLS
ncbi:DnaJ domain-containing protein [Halohasta salina]|uniref:DnaJ domain-containing protein n=1 Tax=Halohasta salina TaxID=2961621 RepID=UPI0020A457BA|nr:DnaJ domain-containing protein [Halohasta salina]